MGNAVGRKGERGDQLLFEVAPEVLRWRVSFVVWRVARVLRRRGSERLARLGISPTHYSILCCLEQRGTCCQKALSEQTGIGRSDLTAPIDALLDRELIDRTPDDADRRRDDIRLTGRGARLLERADRELNAAENEVMNGLSGEERAQLGELVGRVIGCARDC
jgi:DNA-binding MarR family transcriptional regulator